MAMTTKWLLTFLGIAVLIFSLGAFMQYSGDHKECVSILESGFELLSMVVIFGLIYEWWKE